MRQRSEDPMTIFCPDDVFAKHTGLSDMNGIIRPQTALGADVAVHVTALSVP